MPVVGVLAPEARAAVQATRNRVIGLLATEATVAQRALHAGGPGARRRRPCRRGRLPEARAADRGRRRRGRSASSTRFASTRRRSRRAGVDTVILGCTHYPLIRPVFERVFGRVGDARLLGRGDGPRGGRDARAQGRRERSAPRGQLPLPDDRLGRGVPAARRAVPAASDREPSSTSRSRELERAAA